MIFENQVAVFNGVCILCIMLDLDLDFLCLMCVCVCHYIYITYKTKFDFLYNDLIVHARDCCIIANCQLRAVNCIIS